jgi:O-antigen/teichoic acid export membrane protein
MGTQKTWAIVLGIILLLVGIIGFFTTEVFGLFPVNGLHNVVHLLTGALFLWAGLSDMRGFATGTNKWVGVVYILVAIIGFLVGLSFLNVSAGNDPDNWLHLVIGVGSAAVGWMADPRE